jgi:hypothetical protein
VSRSFERTQPAPYSLCTANTSNFDRNRTLIDFMHKLNREYTQSECIRLCENMRFLETAQCNCNLSSIEDWLEMKCSLSIETLERNETLSNCARAFKNSFVSSVQCADLCPLECEKKTYKVMHTAEMVPTDGKILYNPIFAQFDTYEEIKKYFFSIRVFYQDSIGYTLVSQEPKMKGHDLIVSYGIGFIIISTLFIWFLNKM